MLRQAGTLAFLCACVWLNECWGNIRRFEGVRVKGLSREWELRGRYLRVLGSYHDISLSVFASLLLSIPLPLFPITNT